MATVDTDATCLASDDGEHPCIADPDQGPGLAAAGVSLANAYVAAIDASQGLGCQLIFLVQVSWFAEQYGLVPYVELVSGRAYRAPNHTANFLRYGFDPCGTTPGQQRRARNRVLCGDKPVLRADRWFRALRTITAASKLLGLPRPRQIPLRADMDRAAGHAVFRKYLRVRPDIRSAATAFWKRSFGMAPGPGSCVIGVHYRGHDKVDGAWAEAARMPFDTVLSLVLAVAGRHRCTSVLAASDEPDFVAAAARWGVEHGLTVATPGLTGACGGNCTSLHYGGYAASEQNVVQVREAVGAMLMLSWVRHLVKTPSLFSSVSALLDPELEVSLTHKPDKYLQFPENGMPTTAQYLADMQQE